MADTYTGPKYSETEIGNIKSEPIPFVQKVEIEEQKGDAKVFRKYGILSLIFSIVYTFCLYKNHAGITYPIFMFVTLTLLHILRKKDGLSLFTTKNGNKAIGIFHVAALMLLSIHKCMSTSWALLFLDGIAIFLLFFSLVLYLYVDTTGWDIAAWVGGIMVSIFLPFAHLLTPFFDMVQWFKGRGGDISKEKKQVISAVVIGIICAIPMLVIVISLLSSADLVFNRMLEKIVESIHLPDNFEDIVGITCTLLLAFLGAYLIPFVFDKGEIKIKARGEGKANPIIAITFTTIIGLVYLVFCLIQVMFLFTGTLDLPSGYTYAEYAHEGFYQLLTVCLINVVMVSVCTREFKKSKALNWVLFVIGACTYIMIASSVTRMIMYIQVYNLTFLRLFVLWFLAVLCIWLAFLMVTVLNRSFPVFKACMITITVAYIGFVFANPDYQIAKYDLAVVKNHTYQESYAKIDEYDSVTYYILNNLSTDAAPALVDDEHLLHKFGTYIDSRDRYSKKNREGIRKYNFSYARAQKLFKND
ncbi:DUF4173 domain-containing protein [Butyrivibrio fibrisolvens]|uniref:DUF4153 domain-containing protein n=1 Tax=Pseudobutyrivibrio ruminis TaxID=46206 RepID=UPI000414C6F7|nr:DUF4173 domain-containing protein [Pseudobutyrivibrio ruminis]MDC7278145.1 DUF4173 domain-containing protein [Butyrivibrio fibrisolvens]